MDIVETALDVGKYTVVIVGVWLIVTGIVESVAANWKR